ncbi:hypothetical protein ACWIGW_23810 [Nocardia brasiliensis]
MRIQRLVQFATDLLEPIEDPLQLRIGFRGVPPIRLVERGQLTRQRLIDPRARVDRIRPSVRHTQFAADLLEAVEHLPEFGVGPFGMASIRLVDLRQLTRQRRVDSRNRVDRLGFRRAVRSLQRLVQLATDLLEPIEDPLQLRIGFRGVPPIRLVHRRQFTRQRLIDPRRSFRRVFGRRLRNRLPRWIYRLFLRGRRAARFGRRSVPDGCRAINRALCQGF